MNRPMKDVGIDWIGEIPQSWEIGKVRNVFLRKKNKAMIEDPVVLSLARSGVKVRDISKNEGQLAESYYEYNSVIKGDLLLNTMDLVSGANCSFSNVEGVISPAYTNLGIKDERSPKYYDYFFKLQYWSKAFFAHGKGVSYENRWTLNNETLMNYYLPIPSSEETWRIATFLDDKNAHIESIIDDTKQSIEEFKKYKQAVITEAVTKGLCPDVEMKDSGIEWVGKIPKHWETTKIKNLFKIINVRNTGDENALLLSLFTAIGVKPRSEMEDKGNKNTTVIGYKIVKKGDLVVNKLLAWMGAIGYSEYDGVTSPDYDVYRALENATVVQDYYNNYFRHTKFKDDCYKFGRGIMMMRWRTYPEQFKQIPVLNPPREEQIEIVQYINSQCTHIDNLIEQKKQLITELETYKKSLIYEYVTGKKEVM